MIEFATRRQMNRLRVMRQDARVSQAEIADVLGMSESGYYKREHYITHTPVDEYQRCIRYLRSRNAWMRCHRDEGY